MADIYEKEPTIYVDKKGNIARVWHPILTPEEREKRQKMLEHQCIRYMKVAIDVGACEVV